MGKKPDGGMQRRGHFRFLKIRTKDIAASITALILIPLIKRFRQIKIAVAVHEDYLIDLNTMDISPPSMAPNETRLSTDAVQTNKRTSTDPVLPQVLGQRCVTLPAAVHCPVSRSVSC